MRGRRPTSSGRTKYLWLSVYGFVHPASGRNLELILPSTNTDWMGRALEEFGLVWIEEPLDAYDVDGLDLVFAREDGCPLRPERVC